MNSDMIHNALFHNQLDKVSLEVKKEMSWSASIVDRIDTLLREKGMTHRELATIIGCNETQIVRWTRGFPNFTISTLAKLSVALGEDLINISLKQPIVSGYKPVSFAKTQYLSDVEQDR